MSSSKLELDVSLELELGAWILLPMSRPISRRTFFARQTVHRGYIGYPQYIAQSSAGEQRCCSRRSIGFPRACLRFLSGGMDSFNMLVPGGDTYGTYRYSGLFGSDGGWPWIEIPSANSPLRRMISGCIRPASISAMAMARVHCGQERLSLLQTSARSFNPLRSTINAGKRPERGAASPARCSRTAIKSNNANRRSAGHVTTERLGRRASDILSSYYNTGGNSMSISLGGNNVFQVETIRSNSFTPRRAFLRRRLRRSRRHLFQLKNTALRNTLEQHYTNLLTEVLSLTKQSDDAQQLFQTHSIPHRPTRWCCRRAFPTQQLRRTTLKAVVKTIKFAACLAAPPNLFRELWKLGSPRRTP